MHMKERLLFELGLDVREYIEDWFEAELREEDVLEPSCQDVDLRAESDRHIHETKHFRDRTRQEDRPSLGEARRALQGNERTDGVDGTTYYVGRDDTVVVARKSKLQDFLITTMRKCRTCLVLVVDDAVAGQLRAAKEELKPTLRHPDNVGSGVSELVLLSAADVEAFPDVDDVFHEDITRWADAKVSGETKEYSMGSCGSNVCGANPDFAGLYMTKFKHNLVATLDPTRHYADAPAPIPTVHWFSETKVQRKANVRVLFLTVVIPAGAVVTRAEDHRGCIVRIEPAEPSGKWDHLNAAAKKVSPPKVRAPLKISPRSEDAAKAGGAAGGANSTTPTPTSAASTGGVGLEAPEGNTASAAGGGASAKCGNIGKAEWRACPQCGKRHA
jgi:hypothetical protein